MSNNTGIMLIMFSMIMLMVHLIDKIMRLV